MQKKDYVRISEILPLVKSYLSSDVSVIIQQRVREHPQNMFVKYGEIKDSDVPHEV